MKNQKLTKNDITIFAKLIKNNIRSNIIILIIVFIVFAVIFVPRAYKSAVHSSVCRENARRIETAKENAVQYIRDKYGIEAQAVSSFAENFPNFYTDKAIKEEIFPYLTKIPVEMTDGEKTFYVFTNWNSDIPDGCDTYQDDKIKEYISEKMRNVFRNGEISYYDFYNKNALPKENGLPAHLRLAFRGGFYIDKDKYFDNGNFDELADEYYGNITYVCYDTALDDTELFTELRNINIKAAIISFDTEEHMNDFIQDKYSLNFYSSIESYYPYLPYITDFRKIDEEHDEHVDLILNDIDDMKYFADDIQCGIYTSTFGAVRSAFENDDDPENALSPISSEYKITAESGSGSVYIYVPLEKFGECAPENAAAAWCRMDTHRFLRPITVNDRYAIFYFTGLKQTDTVYFSLTEHNWEKTDEQWGKRKLFPW